MQLWQKLRHAKYRRDEKIFLAEGYKVVQELLGSKWKTRAILVMEKKRPYYDDFLLTIPNEIDLYGLSESKWDELTQDKSPEGIMAIAAIPTQSGIIELLAHDTGHILLLHQINNPNNLGALIRTAHWFGIRAIILSNGSVDFTNPKVVRSSMGSLFHLTMAAEANFAELLPRIKEYYFLVGSHISKGVMPHACTRKTALLLGNESHGLPETLLNLSDEQWHIPRAENADSLSLPQAAAIIMYECTKTTTKHEAQKIQ